MKLNFYKAGVIFLFIGLCMRKLSICLCAIFSACIWFSFAAPTVLNPTYSVEGNDVKLYWIDNSDGWFLDINLQDPQTNDWLHFWTAKISDQEFTYTKQRDWEQRIWIIPWDWWDEINLTIWSSENSVGAVNNHWASVTRTVIPVVPKTWPNTNIIWIIIATLVIFGGYVYIKRKADL